MALLVGTSVEGGRTKQYAHLPEGDDVRVSQDAVVQDLPLRVVVYELRSARSIGRKPDSSARSQAAWHFM